MLSHDQLRAFEAVVRAGSFTRAATELHLSQPALSRRVAALEEQLAAVLLERRRGGITLTATGRRLFAFAEALGTLEQELYADLEQPGASGGLFRLAGLSSLVPPVVLPALAPFLHANPAVQFEVHNIETDRLAREISEGGVDFAISDRPATINGIAEVRLGDEQYVMVESRRHATRRDVFLDTSPSDNTTEWFLAAQKARARPARWQRSFLHDEPGILLGVELGLGRAVKPIQTVRDVAGVRVDPTFRPVPKAVYLQHRRQRFYGRLHEAIHGIVAGAVRQCLEN